MENVHAPNEVHLTLTKEELAALKDVLFQHYVMLYSGKWILSDSEKLIEALLQRRL